MAWEPEIVACLNLISDRITIYGCYYSLRGFVSFHRISILKKSVSNHGNNYIQLPYYRREKNIASTRQRESGKNEGKINHT